MKLASAIALLLLSLAGYADDIQPLFINISEGPGNTLFVHARIPPHITDALVPTLESATCVPPQAGQSILSRTERIFRCTTDPALARFALRYPQAVLPTPVIVRITYADDQSHTLMRSPGQRSFDMPGRETGPSVLREYTLLGIRHIWAGMDHLLFLVCLIWIAGTWRRILVTITGFTLAHSVTLILSALDVLRLPVPPVEATIALSVVFLAREVVRGPGRSLTWRHPVWVSSSFGLLHGLGFAAVLRETGLPQKEVMTGLVAFNIGVEIGQLLFVTGAIAAYALVLRAMRRIPGPGGADRILLGYAAGSLAGFWFIERVVAFA
ncbi:MAG: HupE/UreJ family protein [Pseudomonadales bacterium]|nr:HupE/UreJ family protein [Pseudomonadales bacterium]